jgi:hypothetical protein
MTDSDRESLIDNSPAKECADAVADFERLAVELAHAQLRLVQARVEVRWHLTKQCNCPEDIKGKDCYKEPRR